MALNILFLFSQLTGNGFVCIPAVEITSRAERSRIKKGMVSV